MKDAKGWVKHPLSRCPDFIALHQSSPALYPHLLESTAEGPLFEQTGGRFDILFAYPGDTLRLDHPVNYPGGADFLEGLDRLWRAERMPWESSAVPFRGGWLLFLGYELAAQIEPRLRLPAGKGPLPIAFATRFWAALIRDHATGEVYAVAERDHVALLQCIEEDIARLPVYSDHDKRDVALQHSDAAMQEDPPEQFLDGVRRILRYIREGDVFQVNLSRAWTGESRASAAEIYSRLRRANPAPFAGLLSWVEETGALPAVNRPPVCSNRDGPPTEVLCSSPERLLRVYGDRIETRPIAGTSRRDPDAARDAELRRALLAHPKERAEHIMLIDLERNDLGRVCRPGSIHVEELLTLETYAHVHHIVSGVHGRLRAGTTPGEIIRALFPGGTITGCPKVRSMEIIGELEWGARGPYTGAMGYLNRDGDMDLNILIRTLVKQGTHISLRTGAGIVADSVPERELAETLAKAKGVLQAL